MNDVKAKIRMRWWLRIDQVGAWSREEFKAAAAIWLTLAGIATFIGLIAFLYLHILGFGREVCFVGALFFAMISCVHFRRAAGELFPNITMIGDQRAAKRLGLDLPLLSELPARNSLWWIDSRFVFGGSREERHLAIAIWFVAAIIFTPSSLLGITYLQNDFGLSKRAAILLVMATLLPLAFYIGRQLCEWLWPDFVRRADFNAVNRYRNRSTGRSEFGGGDR